MNAQMLTASVVERFHANYIPVTESGCWLWTGTLTFKKYGRLTVESLPRAAHRLSYMIHVGPIPDGMCICHKCDTPPCVNPDHLFAGTTEENVADRVRKGRSGHGGGRIENLRPSPRVLTPEQAQEVVQLYATGLKQKELARRFGCSMTTIWEARRASALASLAGAQ